MMFFITWALIFSFIGLIICKTARGRDLFYKLRSYCLHLLFGNSLFNENGCDVFIYCRNLFCNLYFL